MNKDKAKELLEDLSPVEGRLKVIKEDIKDITARIEFLENPSDAPDNADDLVSLIDSIAAIQRQINDNSDLQKEDVMSLHARMDDINIDIARITRSNDSQRKESDKELQGNISFLNEKYKKARREIEELVSDITESNSKDKEDVLAQVNDLKKELEKDIQLLKNRPIGGGSMNRQIFINGADPLIRYTDLNLKAGSNVSITYQNNDVTKKVDVTFSSSGGGGGGGIVRSVNTVATNTAAGTFSGTDYVYLASGTITITLPTSVGNSNLYTIKNIGAGTVTVATTGGETIDGGLTVTMPVQFTSVDLISNNSGNWDVT